MKTLTERLTELKNAGRPLRCSTLAEFIDVARKFAGDGFATESETETLKMVREHGFEVVKEYLKAGLVLIDDLTEDERDNLGMELLDAINGCAICGRQIPPARMTSIYCSEKCRDKAHNKAAGEMSRIDLLKTAFAAFVRTQPIGSGPERHAVAMSWARDAARLELEKIAKEAIEAAQLIDIAEAIESLNEAAQRYAAAVVDKLSPGEIQLKAEAMGRAVERIEGFPAAIKARATAAMELDNGFPNYEFSEMDADEFAKAAGLTDGEIMRAEREDRERRERRT